VKPETVTEENLAPAAEVPKEETPATEAVKEEQKSESPSEKK